MQPVNRDSVLRRWSSISFNVIAEKSPLTLWIFLTRLLTVPRRLDQMFSDAFSKDHQLIRADPKRSLYLACALMVRGNVQVSDLRRNIERSERRPPVFTKRDNEASAPTLMWPSPPPPAASQIVAPFSCGSSDSWLVHSEPISPQLRLQKNLFSCGILWQEKLKQKLVWEHMFTCDCGLEEEGERGDGNRNLNRSLNHCV